VPKHINVIIPTSGQPESAEKENTLVFRRLFVVIALVGLISDVMYSSRAQAQSAREIAQRAIPSVVMLVMEDTNGQPSSLGSGFFVREGIVATNMHVIKGAVKGYAKIVGQKTKYDISGIVGADSVRDLVLLSIKDATAPSLELGDSSRVAIGDEVYVIGNPRGLEGTFSQGIVSSVREVGTDKILQVTAPISPGSSGGPVLNVKGQVIGVAVATYSGGQNLNFAIPSAYLGPLVSSIKQPTALSTRPQAKEDKSILEGLGGKSTEGLEGSQLTWDNESYGYSEFTFTVRNRLREAVKNIYCLVVIYDRNDDPLDFVVINYTSVVPGGLGKRIKGKFDGSVKKLTTPASQTNQFLASSAPNTKIEFRILDFQVVPE
jgi:S1-C subfamily serine protease